MDVDRPIPDAASQLLARLGARIEYTEREPDGIVNLAKSEITNEDLRDLVFVLGFAALNLEKTLISDAGLVFVGQMSSLESLRLCDALISDSALQELRGLSRLEHLDISCDPGWLPIGKRPVPAAQIRRNQITNAGLGYLADLPSLRSVNLQATRVTDQGLTRHLPELSQLFALSLACLDLTDEGLSALSNLSWLERIDLRHTTISKNAIVELVHERAHSLRRLNLSNTVLDDATLAGFPDQLQLQDVSYSDTGVTDAGCEHIGRYQWLTSLRLGFTDITDDGIRYLAHWISESTMAAWNHCPVTTICDFWQFGMRK